MFTSTHSMVSHSAGRALLGMLAACVLLAGFATSAAAYSTVTVTLFELGFEAPG